MYSIATPHVSNPQMSNCVNQRMEYRVFERLVDRDYSPRVVAVRRAHLLYNLTSLTPTTTLEISPSNFGKLLLSCTCLTNLGNPG